jgi:hypothetical protein
VRRELSDQIADLRLKGPAFKFREQVKVGETIEHGKISRGTEDVIIAQGEHPSKRPAIELRRAR